MTQQTHKKFSHKKDLNYNDLSDFVQAEERLEFLHQIVPKKITVKEFRDILERGSSDSESDSDASSDDENVSDVDEDLVDGISNENYRADFHILTNKIILIFSKNIFANVYANQSTKMMTKRKKRLVKTAMKKMMTKAMLRMLQMKIKCQTHKNYEKLITFHSFDSFP